MPITLLFLPLCFATAQQELLHEYRTGNGSGLFTEDAVSASTAGDVNSDGFDDFILGITYWNSLGNSGAGAARVFSGADGSLLYQYFGDDSAEWLGHAVAAAGDVDGDGFDDFIIGAPNDSIGGQGNGSASVYSGATGLLIHRFTGVDGGTHGAYMGWSVSGVGDLNADGFADILVGAPWASPNNLDFAGSAYVYSGADGAVLHEYHGTSVFTYLGGSTCGIEDIDADGAPDFIVGAPFSSPAITSGGGASVYSGATGILIHQIDGLVAQGMLASTVADAGDVDADGTTDFLLGGPGGFSGFGHASVYSGATGAPIFDFVAENAGDLFGSAVAGIGDVNSDGHADFVIGAPFSNSPKFVSNGSVCLYSGADGSRLQKIYGDAGRMYLGTATANGGDLNNDGRDDICQ